MQKCNRERLIVARVKGGHGETMRNLLTSRDAELAHGVQTRSGMNTTLPGLTIDLSNLRSVFSGNGLPQWSGKVVLTFDDSVDGTTTLVTANWSGQEESTDGILVDFEGDDDEGHERGMCPLYKACEVFAGDWSAAISAQLRPPSAWDAHANDIAHRKANGLPPFFMGN